jgi:soluble lytic murein transglycosylase
MKRLAIIILIALIVLAGGFYFLDQYWIHRYDALIAREATAHHIDPDLVWSIVYEETYFSPWKKGRNGEIGLMQVTPVVAREWAAETGVAALEQRTALDTEALLRNPERNVQIGCWYLEKADQDYRNTPGREARILAAYNAGPSRANEWSRVMSGAPPLTEQEFIGRIDIPSTRAYVTAILDRYHRLQAAKNASPARVGMLLWTAVGKRRATSLWMSGIERKSPRSPPGVPLRFIPGSMLTPSARVLERDFRAPNKLAHNSNRFEAADGRGLRWRDWLRTRNESQTRGP